MSVSSHSQNHLAGETSPYLQQHASNPVDWYPWSEVALAKAEREDKPILLSIGYSACHWCHVMAHESFEHESTAALMNRLYVNIKVDREERPDLDKIYQLALQMLSRRNGGWPLTMFLTPGSLVPFFGGTYFPREARYGMPSFSEVLERVAGFYREQREALDAQNADLMKVFESLTPLHPADPITPEASVLDVSRHQLEQVFDAQTGGFGGAPKFPQPTSIARLMRHQAAAARRGHRDDNASHMAIYSLEKMASGGIYDHLGGGFCRYSTDVQWEIPHFEKMLYDNAQLLPLYAAAWQVTGRPGFAETVLETAEWVIREMQSPEGGFYSSLDADSEGEEGRFYAWTREEVQALLDDDAFAVFELRFGLDQAPNFEGKWHLRVIRDVSEIAGLRGRDRADVRRLLGQARKRLIEARASRIHPGRDEKILTSWNALMIHGMTIAARVLDREDFLHSAERAKAFIHDRLWRNGRLLVTCKDGKAHLAAYLDDYAFLLEALLELLQTRWRTVDLEFAVTLADTLLEHFEDHEHGGFFFTAHDHETLIYRPKPFGDDALPAGNAVAARSLLRLGHLLGDSRYLDAAERTLQAAWPQLSELPSAHNALLDAVEEYLDPPEIVVLRGDPATINDWQRTCNSGYAPARLAFAIPGGEQTLPGLLGERRAPPTGALAYVCSGTRCQAPVDTEAGLRRALR